MVMKNNIEVSISAFGAVTPIGSSYTDIFDSLYHGKSGIKKNLKFCCDKYALGDAGIPDEGNEAIKWSHDQRNIIGETFYASLAAKRLRESDRFPKGFYREDQIGCIIGVDEPPVDLELCMDMFGSMNHDKSLIEKLTNHIRLHHHHESEPSAALNSIHKEIKFSGCAKTHLGLCSASLQAIGMGYKAIQNGLVEAMIVGGVSGKVNPVNAARLELIGAISLDTQFSATERSRPFDRRRSGFVLAEGAVLFLLEKKSNLKKRHETPLLNILGYGASLGAEHVVAPHKQSLEMRLSMGRALNDAGVSPSAIDVINAHGTSTQLNDLHESMAINHLFKDHANHINVVANKSIHGHMIAAAGAMEVLNTIISVNEGFIPGTINLEEQDERCNILVRTM